MGEILDTYNNNTRIHIVKTRITHKGGSKVLSRRKKTNKKIEKTKRCLAWQLNEVLNATRCINDQVKMIYLLQKCKTYIYFQIY